MTSPTPFERIWNADFLTMLEENLACPFTTTILGTPVRVARVNFNDADEIVAICRSGQQRQIIPILNFQLPSPPPQGWGGLKRIAKGRAADVKRRLPQLADQKRSHRPLR